MNYHGRQNSAPPLMKLNISNVTSENSHKSVKTLLSKSLIPLNEGFDKQNSFGTPNIDQMVRTPSS